MAKIKLCGMFRECDIDYVNEAMPDFIGFILNFPKSSRNLDLDSAERLKKRLDPRIRAVGVFVNSPVEYCAEAVKRGVAELVQLHGSEDAAYIRALREKIGKTPVIRAVKMIPGASAEPLGADYLLLDSGTGTGKAFDHTLIRQSELSVPFFLAGGLTPESIPEAVREYRPYAVDLSSGIETNRKKDREKILAAVRAVRCAR